LIPPAGGVTSAVGLLGAAVGLLGAAVDGCATGGGAAGDEVAGRVEEVGEDELP
jgi:hypothetical protein